MCLLVSVLETLCRDVCVYLRAGEARVSEKLLYGSEVGPRVEHVRGKSVPKDVRAQRPGL